MQESHLLHEAEADTCAFTTGPGAGQGVEAKDCVDRGRPERF
jgi:hypothetical protein